MWPANPKELPTPALDPTDCVMPHEEVKLQVSFAICGGY